MGKYPHGPAWSFGDRVPYAEAKNALGGHFGGGLYSPRDPILESKLGWCLYRKRFIYCRRSGRRWSLVIKF